MTRGTVAGAFSAMLGMAAMCLAILSSAEAGETVGWRTDGTGVYADCQPPSKTGPEVNVAWKTPLPDWSNCTPIQVGDRIYITAEPYDVLCIDANGAGILWQKSNGFEDLESPSPEMGRKIQEEVEQEEALIKERKRIRKEQKKLERESKADTANAELKKQIKAKGKELGDIDKKRDALLLAGKVRKWPTHRSNGYSTRTLTSDGTHVFGAFGNGMVVCYDLDGNLKWHVQHKPIFHSWGGSTSPTLVEDRLIVHSDDHYFAHRASDGKELWRHEAPRAYGTPVVALVGETAVLVTPQGVLLDVQNGEQLGEPIFKPLPYNAPLVKDGVVYAVGRKDSVCIAIQLPESAESLEQGGAKVLWSKAVKKDRYYGSPVIDGEGLLYAITRNHVLTVLDTKTGDTVYEEKVPAIKGQSYMSPTLAGGNVYLNGEKGSLVVLKAGKEYAEADRARFTPFRAMPIFDGNRMFLRSTKFLYCFQEQ